MDYFETLPNEIIYEITDNFKIVDLVRFAMVNKTMLSVITVNNGYNDSIEFLRGIHTKYTCEYCNHCNWETLDGECENCSKKCIKCGRVASCGLMVTREVEAFNDSTCEYVCKFGCKFMCAVCECVFKRIKHVRMDKDGWIICNECSSCENIDARFFKQDIDLRIYCESRDECMFISYEKCDFYDCCYDYGNNHNPYLGAKSEHIELHDPWRKNICFNKMVIDAVDASNHGLFDDGYKKVYIEARLRAFGRA